jgi:hypothetical protein
MGSRSGLRTGPGQSPEVSQNEATAEQSGQKGEREDDRVLVSRKSLREGFLRFQ